jgi:hypothetical protein
MVTSLNINENLLQEALSLDRNVTIESMIEIALHEYVQRRKRLSPRLAPSSAEAKAISRLADEDDPSKWITVMEADEEVDEQALDAWLETEGYPQKNV